MTRQYAHRGMIVLDFSVPARGGRIRIRETTGLPDTRENRVKAKNILNQIRDELATGRIDLIVARFPDNRALEQLGVAAEQRFPTLDKFSRVWLDEKENRRQKGTVREYTATLRPHLWGDPIAAKRINTITETDAEEFIARLVAKGAPADRVNRVRARMLAIFRIAQRRFHLAANPFAYVERVAVKDDGREIDPFTADEVRKIIAIATDAAHALVMTAIGTGMRPGELFALKWNAVDFAKNRIHVRQSRSIDGDKAPKTKGSRRAIDMSTPVRDALNEQRARTQLVGPYVFISAWRKPVDEHNWNARGWTRLLRAAKVRFRPFGQCRHTYATLMLAAPETDLRYIADQMGHRNLEMLIKHYFAWMPGRAPKPGTDVIAGVLGVPSKRKEQTNA